MIPILYDRLETRFATNGIGRLSECTRCIVTEERNGIYECEFDIPITGTHYSEIIPNKTTILVTHDDTHDMQPFDVYRMSAPNINGIVTFYAHHISYRLNDVVVMPFTASSLAEAISNIPNYSVGANPFTFWTDKTTTGNYSNKVPNSARGLLGGQENSLLDVYGKGDYEFDRFTVKLHANRGVDSGVEIRYGKNLTDFSYDNDYSSVANAVVPYWSNTEGGIVTLPEKIIIREGIDPIIVPLTDHNDIILRTESNDPIEASTTLVDAVPLDLSDAFEEEPTVEQLRATAVARLSSSGMWEPDETIDVNFVQLWQTEEYKDYAPLQRVRLCDTVTVIYNELGLRAFKKNVVKTTYNVLLDRYDSVELGTPSVSFAEAVRSGLLDEVPTNSMMSAAIKYATEMIRGGLGGYVVMTPGANGYPQEILIMDTPDVNTAVNVWRFNKSGLGHSSNGYQGPFSDIALTANGKINASLITTGSLSANRIKAGTISDEEYNNYWNLSTGYISTQSGKIAEFDITDAGIFKYNPYYRFNSLGISGSEIFTTSKVIDGQTYVTSIERSQLSGGMLLFLAKYNAETPPDDWNDYSQVATLRGGYASDGNPEFRLQMAGFNGVPALFKGSNDWPVYFGADTYVYGRLGCSGTKSRVVKTKNYSERLLYSYETPTPLFGDIGEAQLDESGICYVDIDDIFSETIASKVEYQVFLQAEGNGTCYVSEKTQRYFTIQGTPNLKVAWELKAKQRDYDMIRLEQPYSGLDEYEKVADEADSILDSYITEQEDILYG